MKIEVVNENVRIDGTDSTARQCGGAVPRWVYPHRLVYTRSHYAPDGGTCRHVGSETVVELFTNLRAAKARKRELQQETQP